eukprot:6151395-Alexandrium_andersonii.AAC.1
MAGMIQRMQMCSPSQWHEKARGTWKAIGRDPGLHQVESEWIMRCEAGCVPVHACVFHLKVCAGKCERRRAQLLSAEIAERVKKANEASK